MLELFNRLREKAARDRELPLRVRARKARRYLRGLSTARLFLLPADEVGANARTSGRPHLQNDGYLSIGENFHLASDLAPSHVVVFPGGELAIGDDVSINFGAGISATTRVEIGDRVRIGPYAMILDTDFHSTDGDSAPRAAPITIGADAWIAHRVSILRGTEIGEGAVITAGSVVSGKIPPGAIAGGVPARVIGFKDGARIEPAPSAAGPVEAANDDELANDVIAVVKAAFHLTGDVERDWGPAEIAAWDSMGSMNLAADIEDTFEIELTPDEMASMTTVGAIIDVVRSHRA